MKIVVALSASGMAKVQPNSLNAFQSIRKRLQLHEPDHLVSLDMVDCNKEIGRGKLGTLRNPSYRVMNPTPLLWRNACSDLIWLLGKRRAGLLAYNSLYGKRQHSFLMLQTAKR